MLIDECDVEKSDKTCLFPGFRGDCWKWQWPSWLLEGVEGDEGAGTVGAVAFNGLRSTGRLLTDLLSIQGEEGDHCSRKAEDNRGGTHDRSAPEGRIGSSRA